MYHLTRGTPTVPNILTMKQSYHDESFQINRKRDQSQSTRSSMGEDQYKEYKLYKRVRVRRLNPIKTWKLTSRTWNSERRFTESN